MNTPRPAGFERSLEAELESLGAQGLLRSLRALDAPHGARTVVDGRPCVLFNSNDYLGLANHPRVVRKAVEALEKWGFGSPSSRLLAGTTRIHRDLEQRLADFKREEAAVMFPAGYMANMGVVHTLAGKGDLIVSDEFNHASLVDACRLSRAEVRVYPHKDVDAARRELKAARKGHRAIVLTDAVFSMDGDVAPLPELRAAADEVGAWLVVDEAHATGVLGRTGRGLREHHDWAFPVEATVGTLGKALGGQGGFVAGPAALAELVRNRARTFFYTTAPIPALCSGLIEALSIIEEQPALVETLRRNSASMRARLREGGARVADEPTAIVPLLIGPADKALESASALFRRGYFVSAIRPPTVPEGTSRLRISLSAAHTEDEISAFASAARELAVDTRGAP